MNSSLNMAMEIESKFSLPVTPYNRPRESQSLNGHYNKEEEKKIESDSSNFSIQSSSPLQLDRGKIIVNGFSR